MTILTVNFLITISLFVSITHESNIKQCFVETLKLSECCKFPSHKIVEECKMHLEGAQDESSKIIAGVCYEDCVFTANKLIGEDGKVDNEKSVAYFKETFPEVSNIESIVANATDFCAHNAATNAKVIPGLEKKCNTHAYTYTACLWFFMTRTCPASMWIDSQTCNDIKASATPFQKCFE